MWIVAGLWHNLVLPLVSETAEVHQGGLAIMLLAYVLLGLSMTSFSMTSIKGEKPLWNGAKLGAIVGILWVFPHGLTMAAAHDTSIWYELHNALWHIVEQGAGGLVIALVLRDRTNMESGT